MALTLYGISGVNAFVYDEALNLSRALTIALSARPSGYRVEGRVIGIKREVSGQRSHSREPPPKRRAFSRRWCAKVRSCAWRCRKNDIYDAWSSHRPTRIFLMG
jgi:hypothetical protein